MKIKVFYVNAFTDKLFSGNPAAVCLLPKWLPNEKLHLIAKENNLPITAFLVKDDDSYQIRWIGLEYELDICGHGTLSAAHVIFNLINPDLKTLNLKSRSEVLPVSVSNGYVTLDFPAKDIEPCSLPILEQGLGLAVREIYQYRNERCIAVFDTEEEVKQLEPNIPLLKKLEHRGITVTAPGSNVDFVSRTFYPQKSMPEDPATGASHCLLVPYWAKRLNKIDFHASQLSDRGGHFFCKYLGERVSISGSAVIYMQGTIEI